MNNNMNNACEQYPRKEKKKETREREEKRTLTSMCFKT